MQDRVLGMLGLAEKAGALVSGGFSTENAVKSGKARLVIVSEDAQKNTTSLFENKCEFYGIPLRRYGTKETLGHAIGKGERSCLAVTQEGFAGSLVKLLDSANTAEDSSE